MLGVHPIDLHAGQIEVLQNAQSNQCGDALTIGRNFMQGVAAVVLSNGLYPLRLILRQVFQGHGATMLVRKTHQGLGNFTFIEGSAFGLRNGL